MAALQAAKVPGADSRCFPQNKSSISAYIHVRRPTDGPESYLDLVVSNTTASTDPIDVLQGQFDAWREAQVADSILSSISVQPPGVPTGGADTAAITVTALNSSGQPPTFGSEVTLTHTGAGLLLPVTAVGGGVYTAGVVSGPTVAVDTVTAHIAGGGKSVGVAQIVHYFLCGDVNANGTHTSADIIALVNHIFKGGPSPLPVPMVGDVNRTGTLTSADIIVLVNFVFKSGPAPCSQPGAGDSVQAP
jgi:hypothetical protein